MDFVGSLLRTAVRRRRVGNPGGALGTGRLDVYATKAIHTTSAQFSQIQVPTV